MALALGGAGCGNGSGGGGPSGVDAGDADAGDAPVDDTPPEFAGAKTAAASSPTSIQVGWDPATDDTTPQESIDYLIYVADSSGGQDFGQPDLTTEPGATRAALDNLEQDTAYFFVVRARDLAGNIDENTREVSANTSEPDTEDVSFSLDVQPMFSQNCTNSSCHGSNNPKAGLDLTEGAAHANLVNVASEQCGALMRVAQGDADASYLVRKLTDDRSGCFSGQQMPPSNPLPADDIEIVRAWIEAGAAND